MGEKACLGAGGSKKKTRIVRKAISLCFLFDSEVSGSPDKQKPPELYTPEQTYLSILFPLLARCFYCIHDNGGARRFYFLMTFMGVFLRFRATCNDPRQERHETQALNPAEHVKKAESISLLEKQRRARWLVKEINFVSVRKQRWKPLARSAVAAQLRKAFFSLPPFTKKKKKRF